MENIEKDVSLLKADIKQVTNQMTDVKESVEFTTKKVEDLEKTLPSDTRCTQLLDRIQQLESQMLYQEWRSRKYNLLFYGVEALEDESVGQHVRNVCVNTLKIAQNQADCINIANCHRIPRNRESDNYNPSSPDPIIVKFCKMNERDLVLHAARNLKKSDITVRTDLPREWKQERGKLASTAYHLRKDKHIQTAIRESAKGVWLECRKDKDHPWQKYKPD